MWEFFSTKPAGCLLQSYSGECKAIIHVILFFMARGSLLSRARPSEQVHCLQKHSSLVVFMENYSTVPWVPPQQVLMLLVTRAEVLWGDSVWTGCQAGYQWDQSATAPSCILEGRAGSVPSPHHTEIPTRQGHFSRKESKTFAMGIALR